MDYITILYTILYTTLYTIHFEYVNFHFGEVERDWGIEGHQQIRHLMASTTTSPVLPGICATPERTGVHVAVWLQSLNHKKCTKRGPLFTEFFKGYGQLFLKSSIIFWTRLIGRKCRDGGQAFWATSRACYKTCCNIMKDLTNLFRNFWSRRTFR